jgi:YHS domain-containing protein
MQDPVCGKWFHLGQAEAAIEYQGRFYHVCCPLCQEKFEREPGRYARMEQEG